MFRGLSRDYPGTVPACSGDFLGILFMCFPFFQEKGKHINKMTPTHFRDNPAKLFMFIGFSAPRATKTLPN